MAFVKKTLVFFSVGLFPLMVLAQTNDTQTKWVDSVFNTLNTTEKIGQLFMVSVSTTSETSALNEIENNVKSRQIGSIFLKSGSPVQQARLIHQLQDEASVPLIVAMDAEWGLGKSMDSTISFPPPLVMGAIRNDSLTYAMGEEIAHQLKLVGVNMNFAPIQSFGGNKFRVAQRSLLYMKALQENQVLSCARSFPVKGITITDVQKGFPSIQLSLDSAEVYPYQTLFNNGLSGVVPAIAEFPMFYSNVGLVKKNNYGSSSLASLFTGDWMKKKMNFTALTFANIPGLKLSTEKYRAGEAEALAFQAGNDILINPTDVGPAIRRIRKLVRKEKLYEYQLDATVKKILYAKYNAGLSQKKTFNTDNLVAKLNRPEARILNQKLYEAAVTVARDQPGVLPVKTLDNNQFAYISGEAERPNDEFYHFISKYVSTTYFAPTGQEDRVELLNTLEDHDVIVVGIFPQTSETTLARIDGILQHLLPSHTVVICDFGNEFFLKKENAYPTIITAYVNTKEMMKNVAEVIFGALPADGILPTSFNAKLPEGSGVATQVLNRLKWSVPEDAGMNANVLNKIDSIAKEAIVRKATPGCQILVAKDGKVVYEKSFGTLSYEDKTSVSDQTIYDLASLTKVSATLQVVMFMYEKGLIDIYKKASVYLPELKHTNKKDVTIVDMLTHQAGLVPFIPLWNQTVKDSLFLPLYYNRERNPEYPLQVSPNLFAASTLRDSVWMWIEKSKMQDKIPRTGYTYRYSDLGFMILLRLAERVLNQPLEDFLQQNFYEPLGASTTGFTPLNHFQSQRIAPTEFDKIYRKSLVQGTVHDERAAMMGGVSGHAGLFSTANDLAKLGQMLLQNGYYGGYQYFKPETVARFTAKQYDKSRRGLGWDKPVQGDWSNSPTSILASPSTFGHTGFTGTCMWIDPEFNLVYIFLSNRVYPDRNTKLINLNIRSRIQDVIYQSIFSYCAQAQ
ncbi:MAG TPA: serine hydrolase [Ohtaekwangia sp.]